MFLDQLNQIGVLETEQLSKSLFTEKHKLVLLVFQCTMSAGLRIDLYLEFTLLRHRLVQARGGV